MPSKGRALLGIAALVSSVALAFHFQSFCFKELRVFSNEDYLFAAKQHAFRNSKQIFSLNGKIYKPNNLKNEEFYRILNIKKTEINKGDSIPYIDWWSRYSGYAAEAFIAKFPDLRSDQDGKELEDNSSIYIIVGKCGETWGGSL